MIWLQLISLERAARSEHPKQSYVFDCVLSIKVTWLMKARNRG